MRDDQSPPDPNAPVLARSPRLDAALSALEPVRIEPARGEAPEKPTKWTYSTTRKLAQWILGQKKVLPGFVRVYHDRGTNVRIGLERNGKKILLGSGDSFQAAFENTFLSGLKAKEAAQEESPPEATSVRDIDGSTVELESPDPAV